MCFIIVRKWSPPLLRPLETVLALFLPGFHVVCNSFRALVAQNYEPTEWMVGTLKMTKSTALKFSQPSCEDDKVALLTFYHSILSTTGCIEHPNSGWEGDF